MRTSVNQLTKIPMMNINMNNLPIEKSRVLDRG